MKLTQVNVLGETIIDIYTNCLPLAKSSKDPILAFQKFDSQQFLGGVLAIADVASQLAESTRVLSVAGKEIEDYVAELNPNRAYILEMLELETQPTIKKHRFVDSKSGYRVFEYYDFDSSEIALVLQDQIIESLSRKINSQSLVIAADYGHGFFAQRMIDKLCALDVFLAVNTQANAGNRGFNTYNKYPRIDFLSLNGNELELALRKKNLDYSEVIPNIMREKACSYAVVTLGGDGLLTFDATGEYAHTPAFASKVVDKVGAGDSVLAIASILGFLNAPKELIGLLSSVVAAFEVEQLGHKSSLDVVSMKKYVKGLLG
jgi:bifunctional ADP-heptose synthase (sugar kinase/adenylyltransferase)